MSCPREVAQLLLDEGYPGEAASRAYYAMFYAAQALLKSEDVDVVKHSGVEAFFGERFAKTARLDPRFHRMLIRARKTREMADYVLGERISAATASEKLRDAKEFVAAADRLLGRTSEAHGDGPAKG